MWCCVARFMFFMIISLKFWQLIRWLHFKLAVDGEEVGEVSTVVHGVILGVEMPFPLANPNACVDSGLTCPLKQGVDYEYRQTLPVLRSYPKVSDDYYFMSCHIFVNIIWISEILFLTSNGTKNELFIFKVSVTVKWELKDVAANKTIICVFIPAKIE